MASSKEKDAKITSSSKIYGAIRTIIALDKKKEQELINSFDEGNRFFKHFNESRLELAFSNFSEDMQKALFEVIYFLHVNEPKHEEHKYTAYKKERVHGVLREVPYETTACLYVPESPHGVVGIGELSLRFQKQFQEYVQKELGGQIAEHQGFSPIYSIASLGSIGTIGHKQLKSDLDLQVQYEISPFLIEEKNLSDEKLKLYIQKLIQIYARTYCRKKGYSAADLKKPEIKKEAMLFGRKTAHKKFPLFYQVIFSQKVNTLEEVLKSRKLKQAFVHEVIDLVKLYHSVVMRGENDKKEKLLKDKIYKIQDYVQKKFPLAEIYLFAYSNDDYRLGNHGTTLESKESSGSAYELLLNYDTLMPGIQFSPMIPIHFLMPKSVNGSIPFYDRLIDYIRFSFISLYDEKRPYLVNLGATAPLNMEYMTDHAGAAYWESFKASSGNLPKALLNLFRLEMLFDPGYQTTIIELIKEPKALNQYIPQPPAPSSDHSPLDEDEFDDFEDDTSNSNRLELCQIVELEREFKDLLLDPWWLRYKALKIGFEHGNKRVTDHDTVELISAIMDLCFALHVRLSDVFVHPGEKKEFSTHRDQVLSSFLNKAFPPLSPRRKYLEHIFVGEVETLNQFERDLRTLFKASLNRINAIVETQPTTDKTNQDEFKIWYHYYQENFEPADNVVRRDILSHLKVPRGRLQIGYQDKEWFFRSLQKMSSVGKRFDTFGVLDYLPDEVDLLTQKSFLHGLAQCIMNGYYGVVNKGTLKETTTAIEFNITKMDLGKKSANNWAYIRPDDVQRIASLIDKAFPYQTYDYRDCIRKDREIVDIFFFLNLLEFGALSVLYRDNLRTWYVDQYPHAKVEQNASRFYSEYKTLIQSPIILSTISLVLKKHKFSIKDPEKAERVNFWINPHSADTGHGANQITLKEQDLAKAFRNIVIQVLQRQD